MNFKELREIESEARQALKDFFKYENHGVRIERIKTPGKHTYNVSSEIPSVPDRNGLDFGRAISDYLLILQRVIANKPLYIPSFLNIEIENLLETIPWIRKTETRQECFMSNPIRSYTYGKGRGKRTYTSVPYKDIVLDTLNYLNRFMAKEFDPEWGQFNGCFLNRYDDDHQHLGWHADDFESMDHEHPIAVVSFGEDREIWWRPFGVKGETPDHRKKLLEHGSLFIMRPGFQQTHEHRIPKGSHEMSLRVSMTFRKFL